jgi:predicted HAD superfamily Cof-like phosphohydrolase
MITETLPRDLPRDYDVGEQLDGVTLNTAIEERERAKSWMRTAAYHLRNEEYWRERALVAEMKPTIYDPRQKSRHQMDVETFLHGIGHPIPMTPRVADGSRLNTWGRMLLEETWETIVDGLKTKIYVDPSVNIREPLDWKNTAFSGLAYPNLQEIVDGCADVIVIATGLMSLCGVADYWVLKEIDDNNLLKLSTGRMCPQTGKFLKAADHPKPDIMNRLRDQGYRMNAD